MTNIWESYSKKFQIPRNIFLSAILGTQKKMPLKTFASFSFQESSNWCFDVGAGGEGREEKASVFHNEFLLYRTVPVPAVLKPLDPASG